MSSFLSIHIMDNSPLASAHLISNSQDYYGKWWRSLSPWHSHQGQTSLPSHPMISGLLFFFCYCFPLIGLCTIHSLASNESSDCNIFSGAAVVSEKFRLCNQFSSSRRHRCRLRSSPQDVVLRAHTVRAEGIGGWESCGGALTSPASNVVCKGKDTRQQGERFSHDKNNHLFTSFAPFQFVRNFSLGISVLPRK